MPDLDQSKAANILTFFKQQVTAPARLAGNVLLVHETLDQVKEPRLAWVYNAGQRRAARPAGGLRWPGHRRRRPAHLG